jgi:hypothetical protein
VLAGSPGTDSLRAWRTRMIGLYGGLGDRFALYPSEQETA